jgi:hypothetical protein
MAPGEYRPSRPRVAALTAALLILGPSTVWAHGETPHEWATTGQASLWALLSVAALLAICITRWPHFQSPVRSVRLEIGRGVSWAVLGLVSVHLIALAPHLVHHLASPVDEGLNCALFVQANTSDQERAEPVPLVVSPSQSRTMGDCPAPPAVALPIPTRSGRSPPGLWI